ncbi:DUF3106 domain-containing protein, partial [Lysobacter xanthus]
MIRSLVLAPLLLLAAALPAQAQVQAKSTATLPDWEHLTPAQREQLVAPLRDRWNANPDARTRMLGHAQRWSRMTPEQRGQARRGMERWQGMSPDEARTGATLGRPLSVVAPMKSNLPVRRL